MDETRQLKLRTEARYWVIAVTRIAQRMSPTSIAKNINSPEIKSLNNEERIRQLLELALDKLLDVHILALAFRHIEEYLKQIKKTPQWSGSLEKVGKEFLQEYNTTRIKDFRDVLEHQAEYIAGSGRKPKLVKALNEGLHFGGIDKLQNIGVFGVSYNIQPLVEKTLALDKPLKEAGPK